MTESMLRAIEGQRLPLRQRWETLLRLQKHTTPLANPDILVHMMDWTLDRIFEALHLAVISFANVTPRSAFVKPLRNGHTHCNCEHSPYPVYFITAEMALMEITLPLIRQNDAPISVLTEIQNSVRRLGTEEIETFCSLCNSNSNPRKNEAAAAAQQAPV